MMKDLLTGPQSTVQILKPLHLLSSPGLVGLSVGRGRRKAILKAGFLAVSPQYFHADATSILVMSAPCIAVNEGFAYRSSVYRANPKAVASVVLAWPGWAFCVVRYVPSKPAS
jgi:hypothetical protein